MSEQESATATIDAPPADEQATVEQPLFSDAELKSFDRDDVEAGRNICKMLSLFFFYTVIMMGASTLYTLLFMT